MILIRNIFQVNLHDIPVWCLDPSCHVDMPVRTVNLPSFIVAFASSFYLKFLQELEGYPLDFDLTFEVVDKHVSIQDFVRKENVFRKFYDEVGLALSLAAVGHFNDFVALLGFLEGYRFFHDD